MTKPKSIEKEAILRYSFLSKEVFLCKILQKYICILYKKKSTNNLDTQYKTAL